MSIETKWKCNLCRYEEVSDFGIPRDLREFTSDRQLRSPPNSDSSSSFTKQVCTKCCIAIAEEVHKRSTGVYDFGETQ